ncbi:MAG: hypothetical protein ACREBE_27315, partial [bacterium]
MADAESDHGGTLSIAGGSIASTAEASSAGDANARGGRASDDIGPGDCVGRYTVRSLLGAGGMGQVFAAYDPERGRDGALKLIRPGSRRASRA